MDKSPLLWNKVILGSTTAGTQCLRAEDAKRLAIGWTVLHDQELPHVPTGQGQTSELSRSPSVCFLVWTFFPTASLLS